MILADFLPKNLYETGSGPGTLGGKAKILFNSDEEPFDPLSTVQAISIMFPERLSYTSGSNR